MTSLPLIFSIRGNVGFGSDVHALDVLYKVAEVQEPPTSTTQISLQVVLTSTQKEPLFETQMELTGTRRSLWGPGGI